MKELKPYGCIGLVILVVLAIFGGVGGPLGSTGPAIADGQVYSLHLGSTVWGIMQCLKNGVGTRIYYNELHDAYMFSWGIMDGWGFALTGGTPELVKEMMAHGSNFVNGETYGELREYALENGWRLIPASQVPMRIKVIVTGANVAGNLSATFTTFLVLPYQPTMEMLEMFSAWKGVSS